MTLASDPAPPSRKSATIVSGWLHEEVLKDRPESVIPSEARNLLLID